MKLKQDHFFLTATSDIQAIAAPLKAIGINYFSWGRHYHDGGRSFLCNAPENIENYYANSLYRVGNTEAHPASYHSQIVLWSTLPNQSVFDFIKTRGVSDGIFIIEPKQDYCEFTAFGLQKDAGISANIFLTYIEYLKKYKEHFKDKAKNMIKKSELNKIYLPYHGNQLQQTNSCDPLSFLNESGNTKLSPRQLSCARFILEGKTINEIALILSLSPRTIETYINNLKIKLNCQNKVDLIMKLIKLLQ